MLVHLLKNGPLATLVYLLVLAAGVVSYQILPRQQDPSVNLNYLAVNAIFPGATAEDVERQVTTPLERAIARVADIKFMRSLSRNNLSTITLRFNDIPQTTFDRRVEDVRREVQNALRELPPGIDPPQVTTLSTANLFPSAMVVVIAREDGEQLQRYAYQARQDLERFKGVDRVDVIGERKPELQVLFDPRKMVGLGISPTSLADTVATYYRDLSAGDLIVGDQKWQVRLGGTTVDPLALERLPVLSARGEVPLRSVADVVTGREDARERVRYQGQPTVLLSVMKVADSNLLRLIDDVKEYIDGRNQRADATGVRLALLDDTTDRVRESLQIMENNALVGLVLVLLVSWLFLGLRLSILIGVALPFILAGIFTVLLALGETLNVIVLLGIVICLGMLLDDSVVVVEAISFRTRQGMDILPAAIEALRETFSPVLSSSLTTMAAFVPLMLLPGVLGDFMRVIPIVVVIALSISLVECYWMLPAHAVVGGNMHESSRSRGYRWRRRGITWVQNIYARFLLKAMRHPWLTLTMAAALSVGAVGALAMGVIRTEFFASDPFRLFYVNVQMPPGTTLAKTLEVVTRLEEIVKAQLRPDEIREVAAYAGQRFTDQEPAFGDEQGQVFVSLRPCRPEGREVDQIIDEMRPAVNAVAGPKIISFLRRQSGPPTLKPISLKVRGDDYGTIRRVANRFLAFLKALPAVSDVTDDDARGGWTLAVTLDPDAILRAGLSPDQVIRSLQLLLDGEIASSTEFGGEKVNARVRARSHSVQDIDSFLNTTLGVPKGGEIPLGQLVHYQTVSAKAGIHHYDLRRSITVEADLDKRKMDTPAVLRLVRKEWGRIASLFPGVDLDLSGELDDINEAIQSLGLMFTFGIGLIYLILGAQFHSYIQPLLVITAVPLAFIGVLLGLLVTHNPLSVYTLYGVVALAGIAVNAAIVLLAGSNAAVAAGVPVPRAAFYAARRRVVPIAVTTLTTIAGLVSLAMGWGGKSLMWGPIATAIVWGLGFSAILGLLVVPVLYSVVVRPKPAAGQVLPLPRPVGVGRAKGPGRWLRQLRGTAPFTTESGAKEIAADPALAHHYNEGCKFLEADEYEQAIRCFEKVANAQPDNLTANLSAVQALVMLMQHHIGWDIGYEARARRYLERARRIDREHPRLLLLEQAGRRLEQTESVPGS